MISISALKESCHEYGFMLDGEQVMGLTQQIRTVWDQFELAIEENYRI